MRSWWRTGASSGGRWWAWLFVPLIASAAPACRQALSTVFDVPPPKPKEGAAAGPAAPGGATRGPAVIQASSKSGGAQHSSSGASAAGEAPDTIVPEIERLTNPDSVLARLPKDHAGNVDWAQALRDSVIRPRRVLPGRVAPPEGSFTFAFDFSFKGPDTTFDARFPHSTHTEWIACQQCHPRIFPYRDTPVKMADVLTGKYCGECHGKVAFPPISACERCHVRLAMPPNRAKAEFIGNVQLARTKTDSGNAKGVDVAGLPRATFPHWAHRMRFRCKVCHLEVFEPRGGANQVTMLDISQGKACGRCHDGRTAFRPGIGNCERCHLPEHAPGPQPVQVAPATPSAPPPSSAPADTLDNAPPATQPERPAPAPAPRKGRPAPPPAVPVSTKPPS